MIGAIGGWILSKTGIGRTLQIVILVGIVLGIVFFAGKRIGTSEGKAEVTDKVIDQDVADWKTEKLDLMDRLDAAVRTAEEASATARISSIRQAEASARARDTDARIRNLERSREAAATSVSRISDENLDVEIKRTLGIRNADALTMPGFLIQEQRTILSVLTDYPILKDENSELGEKVAAMDEQVAAMSDRIGAMETMHRSVEEQRDLWQRYGDRMDVHYRDAVNAIGRRKRAGKCLWLWKCTDKKIGVPTPEELKKLRPEAR